MAAAVAGMGVVGAQPDAQGFWMIVPDTDDIGENTSWGCTCSPPTWYAPQDVEPTCSSHHSVLSLMVRVLYFTKWVLYKAAKNYHAFPVALALLPWIVGMMMGYYWGRRQRHRGCEEERRCVQARGRSNMWLHGSLLIASASRRLYRWLPRGCMGVLVATPMNQTVLSIGEPPPPPAHSVHSRQVQRSDTCEPSSTNTTASRTTHHHAMSLAEREDRARQSLHEEEELGAQPESGVPVDNLPKHIAVIMDGNRRYGQEMYGDALSGHWDGCRKLLEFCTWCQAERIPELTVYAFSTENWNRSPREVDALMGLFLSYCRELRIEAMRRSIRVVVLSTETARIPPLVRSALDDMERDTTQAAGSRPSLQLNVCLSYGSRGEIVQVCRTLVRQCVRGEMHCDDITEHTLAGALSTTSDPDLLIRTSGEMRLSNFLLWQLAYAELFFVTKRWPELVKNDFVSILQSYGRNRQRRYGK